MVVSGSRIITWCGSTQHGTWKMGRESNKVNWCLKMTKKKTTSSNKHVDLTSKNDQSYGSIQLVYDDKKTWFEHGV